MVCMKSIFLLLLLVIFADPLQAQERKSTATSTVQIMDTAFQMQKLGRTRRIWIRLPRDYDHSRRQYPVLYMHDGQNLFDRATSYAGEWGVDEALDSLGIGKNDLIVVGIDNGSEKRLSEYSPYDFRIQGSTEIKGEGTIYAHFLVNELKPYIDKHYRTKRGRKFTFMAGSSMGGLISFYTALQYPKTFGRIGVFSPSFWISKTIYEDIDRLGARFQSRIYFFAGLQESPSMVPDMLRVFERIRPKSKVPMTVVIRSEGKHNEATWQAELPLFFQFLFKK